MTPNDIEILIHCYVCPRPHPRASAPGVVETLNEFVFLGLVEKYGNTMYRTTDRGKAYMEMLCTLPLPVQKWVDQSGKVINI